MKRFVSIATSVIILSIWSTKIFAQEEKKSAEEFSSHSTIGIVVGHAHIFDGRNDAGKKKMITIPSWGIDYNYHISPKWAIGLHTDIIIENFSVGDLNGIEIERTAPVAPALMGIYKANEHWNFLLGVGEEFAKEGNFFLNRLGIEYEAEIRNGWQVTGSLGYDIKWDAYDTWVIGIGVSKSLGCKKKKSHE